MILFRPPDSDLRDDYLHRHLLLRQPDAGDGTLRRNHSATVFATAFASQQQIKRECDRSVSQDYDAGTHFFEERYKKGRKSS